MWSFTQGPIHQLMTMVDLEFSFVFDEGHVDYCDDYQFEIENGFRIDYTLNGAWFPSIDKWFYYYGFRVYKDSGTWKLEFP